MVDGRGGVSPSGWERGIHEDGQPRSQLDG